MWHLIVILTFPVFYDPVAIPQHHPPLEFHTAKGFALMDTYRNESQCVTSRDDWQEAADKNPVDQFVTLRYKCVWLTKRELQYLQKFLSRRSGEKTIILDFDGVINSYAVQAMEPVTE